MRQFNNEMLRTTSQQIDKSKSNIELNKPITIDEVRLSVHKSKNNKAVGVDHIPNELLKQVQVIEILTELFNNCLKNQLIPETWKLAIIHPIPKSS